jgi:hypothetical protein
VDHPCLVTLTNSLLRLTEEEPRNEFLLGLARQDGTASFREPPPLTQHRNGPLPGRSVALS